MLRDRLHAQFTGYRVPEKGTAIGRVRRPLRVRLQERRQVRGGDTPLTNLVSRSHQALQGGLVPRARSLTSVLLYATAQRFAIRLQSALRQSKDFT